MVLYRIVMLHFFFSGVINSVNGEGNGNPLQYSSLENPMDRGALWAAVHEVSKSRTWLSDFTFTFHFHALEKEMAAHSSILAWRIPGMGEPGGLLSKGSHRVRHDWSDLAAADSVKSKGEVILFLLCFLPSCKLEFSGALSYLHLVTSVLNKSTYTITNCYIYFLLATCSSAIYSMMLKALWVFRVADASFYLIC